MSLRSKPLELVDELKIALLLMQAGRLFMSLRSKPLELVDELKDCFAPDAGGVIYLCCFATNRLRISCNQEVV
jgi:hypothetical protein